MSYRSSRFYTGSWGWRRVCVSLWWKTLQVKDLFWDHNRNPEAFFLEKSIASQVLCWRTKKVTIKQTPSAPRPTVLSLSGMDHRCEGGRLSGGQMSKQAPGWRESCATSCWQIEKEVKFSSVFSLRVVLGSLHPDLRNQNLCGCGQEICIFYKPLKMILKVWKLLLSVPACPLLKYGN